MTLRHTLLTLKSGEARLVLLSAGYFFLLLCAYYIMRPLREEMGIAGGVNNLPWLFMVTMACMILVSPIFGWLVSRFDRVKFISICYRFFALNLLLFFTLLSYAPSEWHTWIGRGFYVWVSVFNLFAVSLFWSFMAQQYSFEQSKRLFALIAVGGTMGALLGATLTQQLVVSVGRINLLLVSALILELVVWVVRYLSQSFPQHQGNDSTPTPTPTHHQVPSSWRQSLQGIGDTLSQPYLLAICGYLFFYSISSTFLYFIQASIVADATLDREVRAQIFATMDMWVNGLTLFLQLFVSGALIRRFGIRSVLMAMPVLMLAGFFALLLLPELAILILVQTCRRAGNYALFKPARETLFTVIPDAQKYKAKNFIDTFVYRLGDASGAAAFKGLQAIGAGVGSVTALMIPVAAGWATLAFYLGNRQKQLANETPQVKAIGVTEEKPDFAKNPI